MDGRAVILAGTGHRPDKISGGYSEVARVRLVDFAEIILRETKPDRVVSGMALGWDQALVEAALRLNIPFVAALPFGGQELTWPTASQERYRELLKKAVTIKLVCEGGYASWKYQLRNEYLVTSCHLLVALWDGSDGGTANCVKYAKKCGRTMLPLLDAMRVANSSVGIEGGLTNVWNRWTSS